MTLIIFLTPLAGVPGTSASQAPNPTGDTLKPRTSFGSIIASLINLTFFKTTAASFCLLIFA